MAKEKEKHDGLLCFLLALIVVLILVIGGGAYYFLVVDNGEEIAENENANNFIQTNTESNTEKLENKLINLSEAEKKEINKKLDNVNVYMTNMLDYVKSSDNNFTEKEMVEIAYAWAVNEDENFEQFIQAREDGNQKVNIDYVEKWVKKVFNKTVNVENIEGLTIDGQTVLLGWPNGIGPAVFKVQKLELNEATDTYSLYIDKLDLTWIEGRIEELKEITDYTNYKLENSYVLRYKKLNGEKYIVDIVKEDSVKTLDKIVNYKNAKYGIEFSYPSTFAKTNDSFEESGFEAIEDSKKNRFQVEADIVNYNVSLTDLIKEEKELTMPDGSKFRTITKNEEYITLDSGIKGYRFECTDKGNAYQIFFITQKNDKICTFVFTMNDKTTYDEYIEMANDIINSIEIN